MTPLKLVRIVAWCLLLGIVGMIATVVIQKRTETAQTPIGDKAIGGAFKLTNHLGEQVVDTNFVGKPYLVFFGYTHCPDICPATLYDVSLLLKELGKDAKDLKVLFVTVDPERDTPEVLKTYLQSFDSNIIGLTGSKEEIDLMLKSYRAYAKKAPMDKGEYSMDHSTAMYVMGRFGTFITVMDPQSPLEKRVATLKRYL